MTAETTGGRASRALLNTAVHLTRSQATPDLRAVIHSGGREGDAFYRDRWSHDKVVRSTHGVNCTGSCSWNVYVKDGIITWETQATDYPSWDRIVPSTSPADALGARRSPGTRTHPPGSVIRTDARC